MKRIFSVLVVIMIIFTTSQAAFVYPQYTGDNRTDAKITERVNIVFDNSGHEYVKEMLIDILSAASVAEKSEIWIYPISGNVKPIKVEPGKDFAEKYFNSYSKSSNEFKDENVIEKALGDLNKDSKYETKRFVLYANHETSQLRSEYQIYSSMSKYMHENPDVTFSVLAASGYMLEYDSVSDSNYLYDVFSDYYAKLENYDTIPEQNLLNFMLVKNGYSSGEASYDEKNGVIKIEKGKGDNNIYVKINGSSTGYVRTENGRENKELDVYLGGCMMGTDAYNTYLKKSKVSGVALSYNHLVMETGQDGYNMASALYTADGEYVNPAEDTMYIPAINADSVVVYHRSTKGSGVSGKKVTYKTNQDKEILNSNAPTEGESSLSGISYSEEKQAIEKALSTGLSSSSPTKKSNSLFSVIGKIFGVIFKLIFFVLRLAIFAFIIFFIANKKFRSYVQLKILDSKFGPKYESIVKKVKKIITDIAGSGVKIRGDADLKGKFVFISKASADMGLPNNRISLVVKELESRGVKCWLSENGIKPGQDYNVVLPEAIKSCTLFLLFVSPMSVKSSEVVSEIGTAKEHKKPIIPVQIEPFDLFKEHQNWAYMLKQYQKTDLFRSKTEEIKALADHIEKTFNGL